MSVGWSELAINQIGPVPQSNVKSNSLNLWYGRMAAKQLKWLLGHSVWIWYMPEVMPAEFVARVPELR